MKLIFTMLLLIPFGIKAQQVQALEGFVFEVSSQGATEPLWGANVYWKGTTIGTTTDEDGFFRIEESDASSDLIASYVGYKLDSAWFEGGRIHMLMNAVLLEEVEVRSRLKSTGLSFLDPIKTELISEDELLKAACCSLSESFETNPSVDVSFTDAVTGTRQIIMLGLAGPYTQINRESIPLIRGLSAVNGLTYVPGTWIESMQLNKGTGSVVNGYESIAGQINLEYRKPENTDRFYLNLFGNEGGRIELNAHFSHKFNSKWATGILAHAKNRSFETDRNNDGFIDNLLGNHLILLNRWKYAGGNLRAQFGINYSNVDESGGQVDFEPELDALTTNKWGVLQQIEKWDGWAKIGRVFPDQPWKTYGFQLNAYTYDQSGYFGLNPYRGQQNGAYSNFIYQSIFGNTNHKFSAGASLMFDYYDEAFSGMAFDRTEYTPGAFFEYTYSANKNFALVAGLRTDWNNLYGFFPTPRIHMRYSPRELTVFRASGGRGQRTANIMSEHMGVLASSREIIVEGNGSGAYGLDAEVAWNYGFNFTQGFIWWGREAVFSLDLYRTDFTDQVILNLENPRAAIFSNLEGKSRSNSLQVQADYELFSRFDLRIAYRWFDNKSTFGNEFLQQPLIAAHLGFINLAYETDNTWKFDWTLSYQGKKRLPDTGANPEAFQLDEESPGFWMMNSQITKSWQKGKFEVYLGGENLLNFIQTNPIVSVSDPFSPYFDASMIWGPVFGRTIYGGLRYRI